MYQAAVLDNRNQVIGLIDMELKLKTVSICTQFSEIRVIKQAAQIGGIAKMFEKVVIREKEALMGIELESPINSHGYRLSYSKKNVLKGYETRRYAFKIACLDYPTGYYCWEKITMNSIG